MTVHQMELNCRGLSSVVDQWKKDHDNVRQLWDVESLIKKVLEIYENAQAKLSNERDDSFGYFLNVLRLWVNVAEKLERLSSQFVGAGYSVNQLNELRTSIEYIKYFIEANCDPVLQQSLDHISGVLTERLMTPGESDAIAEALKRAPSTIEVKAVPSR